MPEIESIPMQMVVNTATCTECQETFVLFCKTESGWENEVLPDFCPMCGASIFSKFKETNGD